MMAARAPMVMVMIATMVAAPALPAPNEVRYRTLTIVADRIRTVQPVIVQVRNDNSNSNTNNTCNNCYNSSI